MAQNQNQLDFDLRARIKAIGWVVAAIGLIGLGAAYEPVSSATSSNGNGGAGETVIQQTGGESITPTSVVISATKVLAPHGNCPVFESSSGLCQ